MDHNAPFTIQEGPKAAYSPKVCIPLFIAIMLIPIVACGPILQYWDLSLLFSVLGSCAVLWVCGRSLLSTRFVQRFPFLAQPLVRLFALAVGIILLMTPIALYAGMYPGSLEHIDDGNWLITFSSAIFSTIQAVGLNMSPGYWIDDARALGILSDILLSTHAFLIFFYAVACPLAAVFAALDAVFNGISDLRIKFWSWRKTLGTGRGEIYVFHELDEHGTALARSIIEARNERMPLIIFANIGDAEASRDETLMEEILDRARGKANVLYTSLPAEAIPRKLSKRAPKTCAIRYFAITSNSSANIQTCGALWDTAFEQLWGETWRIWNKTYSKRRRHLTSVDYGALCKDIAAAIDARAMGNGAKAAQVAVCDIDPATFDPLLSMGGRLGIHCLYTNLIDGALLDSLLGHNVESIMGQLSEDCQGHRAEIEDGVSVLASCLRNLVDIHLLRKSELAVQNLFVQHPLYAVLDPMALAENDGIGGSQTVPAKEQQLTVLILGCGTYGIEAIRTVFWLGRIARTQLKIVVVDNTDVRQKMEGLYLNCPEIMTERTYSEDLNGPRKGTWSIARRHHTPTVRFCEADIFGTELRAMLDGKAVHTMWYTTGENPSIVQGTETVLGDDDHLYCMVCLGNDDLSLTAGLLLQRSLAERKLRARRKDEASIPVAGRRDNLVPIAIRHQGECVLTSGKLGERGLQSGLWDLGFPLYQFGSISDTFTFASLAGDTLETQAIQINALTTSAHHERPSLRKAEMDYCGLTEFERYRHRSYALSIPSKFWMLGLDASTLDAEGFRRKLCPGMGDGELDGADEGFSASADAAFRSRWPLFSYMADLEHVRWCAFYRSLGWRDATPLLECARSVLPLQKGVSNFDMALHYYLCDDIDELSRRAEECKEHPFAYGRMLLLHSMDILDETVCRQNWSVGDGPFRADSHDT